VTFATQIERQASERTMLARVTPKRNITSTLTLDGGSVYMVAIPYTVKRVTRNGVDLTEASAYPTVFGTFYYDQAAGILYVNSTAPNVSTAVFIAFYRVYLCTGSGLVTYDDPTTTTGLKQQWEPRLAESPTFGSFFDDVLKGVFSYADIGLTVTNGDSWFQSFLTANDSFKSAAVEIWYFVDDLANIQKIYTGIVTKIAGRVGEFTLTISDTFNRLRLPAYMGDTEQESRFEYAGYPNVDPNKNGTPCRFVTGSSSPYRSQLRNFGFGDSAFNIQELAEGQVNEAVCTSFRKGFNPTNNRVWGLHRAPFVASFSMSHNDFASVTRVLYLGENDFFVKVTGSDANYRVGETFRWSEDGFIWCAHVGRAETFYFGTQTFGTGDVNTGTDRITLTAHGMATGDRVYFPGGTLPGGLVALRVYYVNVINSNLVEICKTEALANAGTQINLTTTGAGTMTIVKLDAGDEYNLYLFNACQQNDPTTDQDPEDSFSTAAVGVSTPAVAAILRYGPTTYLNTLYLRYGADYNVSENTTSGGNKFLELTFATDFEGNIWEDATDVPTKGINPSQHKLWYAVQQRSPMTHGVLLERMVENAGLTAVGATFTQADVDLAAFTYMQIPGTKETDFKTYIDYAQLVLKSTLGYLTVNESGGVSYKLIAAPSPTESVDENNGELTEIEIDYDDIAKTVIFYNEDLSDNPDVTQTSNVTRYLHETDNVDRFVHVLADISARAAAIFNIRKNRYAKYKHRVAHTQTLLNLGDDATISSPDVLGGSGSVGTKITGLLKGADAIEVESTDLLST